MEYTLESIVIHLFGFVAGKCCVTGNWKPGKLGQNFLIYKTLFSSTNLSHFTLLRMTTPKICDSGIIRMSVNSLEILTLLFKP